MRKNVSKTELSPDNGCVIVVTGIWRFYRDEYYKGDYWDLGPGFYESFFTEAGPDDVVSSFQAIALT